MIVELPAHPSYVKMTGYSCVALLSGVTSLALVLIGVGFFLGAVAACGLHLYDLFLKKPGWVPIVILLEIPVCLALLGSIGLGFIQGGLYMGENYTKMFAIRAHRHWLGKQSNFSL